MDICFCFLFPHRFGHVIRRNALKHGAVSRILSISYDGRSNFLAKTVNLARKKVSCKQNKSVVTG